MAGEDVTGNIPRRVYMAEVPELGGQWQVFWFYEPEEQDVPSPDFKLTHWPTTSHVLNQRFGVNEENYSMYCDPAGLCLPGHNGWDVHSPLGDPFYAAVEGKVIWASDTRPSGGPSDYGWHVRVQKDDHVFIYAHAAAHPPVSVGDWVFGGQIIAFSGNTGRSSGPHLHIEYRQCATSLPEWPWCIVNIGPLLLPLWQGTPPTNDLFDMLPYFQVVAQGNGPFYVLQHANGPTEDIQHQVEGGHVFIVKNRNYERLRVTGQHIERREDTSPRPGEYYMLDDGYGWSRWMPRFWKVGDVFHRSPDVRFYRKDNCQQLSEDLGVSSVITFNQHYPTWTAPSGIELADVVRFSFSWDTGSSPIEEYWFAKGIGLVQWKNNQGAHSWVSEIPMGRPPLTREIVACL